MFDRFDICCAYYAYAALFHSGQGSPEFSALCALQEIGFSPGYAFRAPGSLSENALRIFQDLCSGDTSIRTTRNR